MNKKILDNKRNRIIIALVTVILFILLLLIFVINSFKNYGQIKLTTNKENIFTYEDLVINDLKYGSKEEEIKKYFGSPKEIKENKKGIYKYKTLTYDGVKLTLKENYEEYILVKVEVTKGSINLSRNIKVGNKITKVFDNFRVDNSSGAYLYGNYKKEALSDKEIKNNIYFGIRTNKNVLYVNRDSVIDDLPTNTATLNIEYDHGTIKKITWSYDVE